MTTFTGGTVWWIMPVGAEVLDIDGRQLFYADEDGSGSVTPLGTVDSFTFTFDADQAM